MAKPSHLPNFIVHLSLPVGVSSAQLEDLENWYHSYLPKTTTGFNDASRIVYSYLNVVAGFAARLSPGLPVDVEGHGTHTASTAAGNFVQDANVFGNANGTAVGMAPHAHLAIYKVCSENGCAESDMLAAIDTAVEEGVDVLSLSIGAGGGNPIPFFNDGIAIGAFGAIQKGVFVSCSAGNSGPESASVSNEAPWILTVGASTTDRNIRATAVLGNNSEFDGESPFQPKNFTNRLLPLVYAGEVSGDQSASLCAPESLDNADVRGKVVLCERGGGIGRINKGQTVKDAGGAAMILMNEETDGYSTLVDAHVLPATHVSFAAVVASFSSRGPSLASPGILKPQCHVLILVALQPY